MIGNKEISIISKLQQNNLQSNLHDMKSNKKFSIGAIDSIDSSLAAYIYCYLSKKINGLPTTEYVDNIISAAQSNIELSNNVISIGYGFIVSLTPETKNFKIEYETSVSDLDRRIDIITSSDYIAYNIIKNIETSGNTLENIDINKEPIFNQKRVKDLQQYLKDYENLRQKNSGIRR